MPEFECDVFLSYKREDKARVEQLANKLTSLGLKVWFDARIQSGDNFDQQIASHLKASRLSIVCWTPEAIASNWVRAEASMAHGAGKLVAAFLEPTELIPPFNLLQTENLSEWRGEDDHEGWMRLLTRVAALSNDRSLQEWSALITEGDARRVREWADAASPGALRATTRFWLSLQNTQPAAVSGKRRKPRKASASAVLAGASSVLAVGCVGLATFLYLDREALIKTASTRDEQFQTVTADVEKSIAEKEHLQEELAAALAAADVSMEPYKGIDRRRKEAFALVKTIDELLARKPQLQFSKTLKAPLWKDDAEAALDVYLAALKAEFRRLDLMGNPNLAPRPVTPDIRPNGG